MDEIAPGLLHWTAFHDRIGQEVSSYYVEPAATLIDPMVPPEGVEALRRDGHQPELIVLTIRHHYRQSDGFVEAFGCPVVCNRAGMHEFSGDSDRVVEPFTPGAELAAGVRALELGAISPDDTALAIDAGGGALAFADGLISAGGRLGFVPDQLMDEPEQVRSATLEALRRMLDEQRFEHLLFAHGEPIVGDGRERLERFVAEAG